MLNCLSVFSGIGGFDLAAGWVGVKTEQFIEIDPFCQKVLNKNFPNVKIHDDVTTFTIRPRQFDFITGGFPCQDISCAGKKRGITGDRSILFYELTRLIKEGRPMGFILENVPAISEWMPQVIHELTQIGNYHCFWFTLSVAALGGCHKRERWFCVGIKVDSDTESVRRQEVEEQWNLEAANGKSSTAANSQSERQGREATGNNQKRTDETLGSGGDPKQEEIVPDICGENDGVSRKLDQVRLMSPGEAWGIINRGVACDDEDIQHRGKRIRALGNAVAPQQAYIAWLVLFELLGYASDAQ